MLCVCCMMKPYIKGVRWSMYIDRSVTDAGALGSSLANTYVELVLNEQNVHYASSKQSYLSGFL